MEVVWIWTSETKDPRLGVRLGGGASVGVCLVTLPFWAYYFALAGPIRASLHSIDCSNISKTLPLMQIITSWEVYLCLLSYGVSFIYWSYWSYLELNCYIMLLLLEGTVVPWLAFVLVLAFGFDWGSGVHGFAIYKMLNAQLDEA